MGLVITDVVGEAALHYWWWRIPFAFGLIIAPIGMVIRRRLAQFEPRMPLNGRVRSGILGNVAPLVIGTMVASVANVGAYVFSIYTPSYSINNLRLPNDSGFYAQQELGLWANKRIENSHLPFQ